MSIDIVSEVNVRKSSSVKFNKLTEFEISQNVLFENGIKRNLSEKKDAQNTLLISIHSRKIKHRMIESKSSKWYEDLLSTIYESLNNTQISKERF